MRDMVIAFIHQYAVWGILFTAILALIVQHCMYWQIRRLNRSLSLVTEKVQQYFDIIMKEEEEEERDMMPMPRQDRPYKPREEDFQLTKGEREMLLSDRKRDKKHAEALDAVLQEYFS